MARTITTEIEIEIDDYVDLYDVELEGGDADLVDITCNTNGDVTVHIDGYIIDKDRYDLLQTVELIDNQQ